MEVRTDKEDMDPSKQEELIEGIQAENAILQSEIENHIFGMVDKEWGEKNTASCLVVKFTTMEQANRVIKGGLVLNAYHCGCALFDRD